MMTVETVSLDALLADLCAIPAAEFTIPGVRQCLAGKYIDGAALRPYTHWRKDHYTRNLIFKNERFEMIGFCWEIGHGAPIHSHNRQLCWMSIQQGALLVSNYRQVRCAVDINALAVGEAAPPGSVELAPTEQSKLTGAGVIAWADETVEIHSVVNSSSFGERAVSVHIYSRPFNSCITYDLGRKSCQRVELCYTSVYGKLV